MASKGKADGESRPTENSYDELEASVHVAKRLAEVITLLRVEITKGASRSSLISAH